MTFKYNQSKSNETTQDIVDDIVTPPENVTATFAPIFSSSALDTLIAPSYLSCNQTALQTWKICSKSTQHLLTTEPTDAHKLTLRLPSKDPSSQNHPSFAN